MKAFIDDFNLIRIETTDYINAIGIEGYQLYWYKNEADGQYFKVNKQLELHEVDSIWINEKKYPLSIGVVTLHSAFDKKFRYDGPLGYLYQESHTSFFVFSPVAKEMMVVIGDVSYPMYYEKPIWTAKVDGNLEGKPYFYRVRLVDQFEDVKDPYTVACNLTDSIIIDAKRLYKQQYHHVELKNYTDAVIYEGHVRDMTIKLDVENKGLFSGLTETSSLLGSSVLAYIKALGMTHLQLLPVFDFYGVDDINKDKQYNWGYNPMQYFALEGWYSKDPNDPYLRINEFRHLTDEAHKIGLGINMDVVFNHVYERALYPYDKLVPGYFFRHDRHNKQTHSAFLDNDLETTHYMVRRLIIDALMHFMVNYKVDGFRFDLMGLMDVETMNQIELQLRKANPSVMLYGEGWNMDSSIPKKDRSNMNNQHLMKNIGHFNDFYRDVLKGELHTNAFGYATGSKKLGVEAAFCLIGSPHLFNTPTKSVNYVECHDNMTFFDMLELNYQDSTMKQAYQDLANHLIAVSQGIPFYHAGQEMYRTKHGVENSYHSPDDINGITWYHYSSVSKLKKILQLRKKYRVYRYTDYPKKDIKAQVIDHYLYYELKDSDYTLAHYIKNDFSETLLPNDGQIIFNSQNIKKNNGLIYIDQPGVYIMKRK